MTWRAFFIGLVGVIGLCLLTPYNDFAVGNTYLTGNHFPVGVIFFVLLLTLVGNSVLRLFGTRWTLKQPELVLVCCMMLVASTVPASGLMRYWFPTTASAPYLAQRSDLFWEDDVLQQAPDGILLSRDMKSVAARKFYQGTREGEVVRVPWGRWMGVIVTWGIFIWLYYLATIFLFGILRKQWVESERLTYAVARIPLEFTEGAGGRRGWGLPALLRSKPFLVGAAVTIVFGLLRLSPLFFGAEEGWRPVLPVNQLFAETDWDRMWIGDGIIFPIAIGFAFLVPADVSLSIWLFYGFMCSQIMVAFYVGRPMDSGPSSAFFRYQQAGAFVAFMLCTFWAARRHLWAVLRKAFGAGRGLDDSAEPIGYRLAFWGLMASGTGMLIWYVHFGMSWWAAVLYLALGLTIVLVHARTVAQGGLFFTQQAWSPPELLYSLTSGRAFTGPAIVVAQVQHALLTSDAREILSPHVTNAFRMCSVFRKGRRLLLPAILVALIAGMLASGYSTMQWVYYRQGALNVANTYSVKSRPMHLYNQTHAMLSNPTQVPEAKPAALCFGAGLMIVLTALRGTFYWWPIHWLGLLMCSSWCVKQLYFSFFLGWLTKVSILKFAGGHALRSARSFFLGVIIAESATIGASTFVSLLTGVRIGYIFLSG